MIFNCKFLSPNYPFAYRDSYSVKKKKLLSSALELWLSGLSCLVCCYLSSVV